LKFSWKTSLCGIIGIFCIGASKTPGLPPWASHLIELLGVAAPNIGLLFSRDNDRTSEEVGIKPMLNGELKRLNKADDSGQ